MNVPVVSHLKLLVNLYNKMNNRFLVLLVIYLIIYLLSVLYKNKQIFCAILLSLLSWERGLKSKAMKKADEEEEEYDKELLRSLKAEYGEESGRRYYDQYRYANGRFAPKGRGTRRGYEEPPYYHMPVNYNDMEYMRDMDKSQGKMYYSEPIAPHVSESNYDRAKRHYTETKEMHKGASTEDKEHKMKALDMYIRELSGDISELLNDMTPDERNLLRTKMSNLASKL